jgi:two-component system cell cycle sensor histidine kinase/response regulator CckA
MARILVVDDNAMIRTVLRTTLEEAGHAVAVAEGGEHALRTIAGDNTFDLIITDIAMPHMGGADLIEALHEASPTTKTLVISGRIDGRELRGMTSMKTLRATGALEKPFTGERLIAKVAEILG